MADDRAPEKVNHGKCMRVEYEWEDGAVQTVHGDLAEKYVEMERGNAGFLFAHGIKIEPLKWEWSLKGQRFYVDVSKVTPENLGKFIEDMASFIKKTVLGVVG